MTPGLGTILVIDDNSDNLRIAIDVLESRGYTTRAAKDGESGLRRARASRPDLILLDIQMPRMDGFEMARQAKLDPELADIPIVFMTSLARVEDKLKAFEAGGVDYITKPFEASELFARVKTHLHVRELQRELQRRLDSKRLLIDRMTGVLGHAEAIRLDVEQHLLPALDSANPELRDASSRVSASLQALVDESRACALQLNQMRMGARTEPEK